MAYLISIDSAYFQVQQSRKQLCLDLAGNRDGDLGNFPIFALKWHLALTASGSRRPHGVLL